MIALLKLILYRSHVKRLLQRSEAPLDMSSLLVQRISFSSYQFSFTRCIQRTDMSVRMVHFDRFPFHWLEEGTVTNEWHRSTFCVVHHRDAVFILFLKKPASWRFNCRCLYILNRMWDALEKLMFISNSETLYQRKPFPFSFLSNTVFNYLFSWLSLCFSVSYFPFTSHSTQHVLSSHQWGNMLFTTLQNGTVTVFPASPGELCLKSHSGLEQLNSHQRTGFDFLH